VQAAENEASQADANLDADLQFFAEQQAADYKAALGMYAACQREHSIQMQVVWDGFINELQKIEDDEIARAAASVTPAPEVAEDDE
jgi:hypothetical protein